MNFINEVKGRQFVDTNILVYAHDESAGEKQIRAQALLTHLWTTQQGCLSLQVLQEFYVTVTRKIASPLPVATAIRILQNFTFWPLHRPDIADLVAAALLQEESQLSFWDALIIHSAQQLQCNIVWTEDLNPGQRFSQVTVLSPFAEA